MTIYDHVTVMKQVMCKENGYTFRNSVKIIQLKLLFSENYSDNII